MDITVQIDSSALNRFPEALRKRIAQAVRTSAFKLEAQAKVRAPVDTGALRASIYTVTAQGSGEGAAASAVQTRRDGTVFVKAARPQGDLEATVAVGVHYARYVEFGTRHSGAQPFLYPAAQSVKEDMARDVKDAVRDAWRHL